MMQISVVHSIILSTVFLVNRLNILRNDHRIVISNGSEKFYTAGVKDLSVIAPCITLISYIHVAIPMVEMTVIFSALGNK
jgi:hypothetical protein